MPNSNWVDYKRIKETISIKDVLARYGLLDKLKQSGSNLVGVCPIHKGNNSRQFSVNPEKNIYNCFGNCKSGGNIIDLVSRMENVSLADAGKLLQEWFLNETGNVAGSGNRDRATTEGNLKLVREERREETPEKVNAPLAFALKSLKNEHLFFEEKGIGPETIEHFGLGFCEKGMMKGRIVIPIHDEKNNLLAYCGRAVTEEQITEEGKYKLPPKFYKSLVVYNLNRQEKEIDYLIVVESYLSVFHLYQAGFKNVVSIMGSNLSPEQEELISGFLGPHGRLILLFDADEDGRICAGDCLERFKGKLFVKSIDVGVYGRKPHQLDSDTLKEILA